MLFKTKTLKSYELHSLDGEIRKVSAFYFDDQHCSRQGYWVNESPDKEK